MKKHIQHYTLSSMDELFTKLQTINPWNNFSLDLGYLRSDYLKKLHSQTGNRLIKVLIGQRRTGKSFLLRQFINQLLKSGINPHNIFYLNKEYIEFDAIKTHQDLLKLIDYAQKQLQPSGKVYLLLDEIQQIKSWEKLVNALAQDPQKNYELYITGSNSRLLSSELATLLSGRYIQLDIFPFSYQEFIDYQNLPSNRQTYINYLESGGLPELFHLQSTETKRQYLMSLRDSIVLKDIVHRYKIKDIYLLEQLFNFLVNNIGNLTSVNKIVGYLNSHKVNTNFETLSNYVTYLQQALLIHEAKRYDIRGKNLLDGERKYYPNDLAFRTYLSSSFDPGFGQRLENNLFLHFLRQGYTVYVGTLSGNEIDFVIEKDNQKQYVQSAYTIADPQTADREIAPLEKIKDAYPKAVITLDEASFGNKNGIQHQLAWQV